jgi:UDP-2-acetamido-2,6-beta-L-arabino-hexul-4-ose reductase
MKTILVTGANGFIGKNLIEGIRRQENMAVKEFDIEDDKNTLKIHLEEADFIFHLAGINRPKNLKEFEIGNVDLTKTIVRVLEKLKKFPPIVFSSSTQAKLNNPYGISKKKAEDVLIEYGRKNKAKIFIFRLPNVFGKWCRPNYNSVVATFCYNISHSLDISISDPRKEIELIYIDDLVDEFMRLLKPEPTDFGKSLYRIKSTFKISLGKLAEKIYQLKDIRSTLVLPDLSDDFTKFLYATYLSHLDDDQFSYRLKTRTDQRGSLAELLKSHSFGQIFISKSHKGIIRGHHYHNTKVEKFCVIQGKALIKLRHIFGDKIIKYQVSGENIEIVDIPPGYTHSIENLSDGELVVIFWASEIFNPQKPDTYTQQV